VELAVTYVEVGREAEARAVAETILKLDPSFSIAEFAKALTYRDPEELDRVVQGMRQAGLPQ
jgi:adenylate cyclase